MGIIYIVSAVILLISFILVKKTEKQLDIISFICISIVTLFCYNTFICYVLTFFTIPITLWLLSLINALISVIFIVLMLRNKQIQKYSFKKIDLLYVILIAVIVLIVSYLNFGFPFDVNYETGDPSVHYLTSVIFAESDALLPGVEDGIDEIYSSGYLDVRKTVSYVNSGLIMKALCINPDFMDYYNIFVCFGIFVLFLTGVSIFSAMKNFARKKEHSFFAFIISVICILGYPLNSLLFGFEYLSMGLLIICSILDLINYYDKELLNLKFFIPIMALVSFGLFSSYYMFVPFVYPALWIYFCIKNYFKTKKIITKELIIILSVTLLIPFILGYIYHLAPDVYSVIIKNNIGTEDLMNYSSYIVSSGLGVNGYIYVNLYSNILLLLPLPIYLIIKDIKNKNKENIFVELLLTLCISFIVLLFIGRLMGKVSTYYLCKNHYAVWIILLYLNYKALITISEKKIYLPKIFLWCYIFLMILCTIFSNVEVAYVDWNKKENLLSVGEIFGANKTIIFDKQREYTREELEILKYAKENLDFNSKIEVVTDENAYYWQYALLREVYKEERFEDQFGGQKELTTYWVWLEDRKDKLDYMIYFNKTSKYEELKDVIFNNSEIIYKNSSGGILKYKK